MQPSERRRVRGPWSPPCVARGPTTYRVPGICGNCLKVTLADDDGLVTVRQPPGSDSPPGRSVHARSAVVLSLRCHGPPGRGARRKPAPRRARGGRRARPGRRDSHGESRPGVDLRGAQRRLRRQHRQPARRPAHDAARRPRREGRAPSRPAFPPASSPARAGSAPRPPPRRMPTSSRRTPRSRTARVAPRSPARWPARPSRPGCTRSPARRRTRRP